MLRTLMLSCVAALTLFGAATAKKVLVLPVAADELSAGDRAAINRLFRDAVEHRSPHTVVLGKAACEDRACALAAAREAGADEVVHSSLYRLGSKLIFAATVTDTSGGAPFSQRLTAGSVEDLETVSLRMADALATRRSTEQVASLDNITARESEKEPERRLSLYHGGMALGYLFPVGNSFSYVEEDEFSSARTRHQYEQMVRLVWMNSWEFRNNLGLGVDVTWSTPYAFGADLNLRYMLTRNDISPFVGGGLGLHYVKSDEGISGDGEKRNSGPAVNVQGGLMLFRTYDVNVMLRGQYQVVFNSDVDHGPAIDVGVSFRDRDKGKGSKDDGMGVWGYVGLGVLFLLIVGAAN